MAGQRLDNYLLGELQRRAAQPRLSADSLGAGARELGARTSPSYRLQAGDRVRVPPVGVRAAAPRWRSRDDRLDWLAERIVYEDRALARARQAGRARRPWRQRRQLGLHRGAARSCVRESKELELAHRLDRGTSGCLLLAKRRSALRVLHALLREGAVDKRYLALVKGRWPEGTTEIDAPLVTRRVGGEARVKVDASGKEARSTFRCSSRSARRHRCSRSAIDTGRTHQIRVHAAHAGHPVAGDERYGDDEFNA